MASSNDLIKASEDPDLLKRVKALIAVNLPGSSENQNTDNMAKASIKRLVGVPIYEDGQTIADVYAYKVATTPVVLAPGVDPSAVTDELILQALRALGVLPSA